MQRELRIAFTGTALLVLALGIGRFVLTPLLPLMQADAGLNLVAGGWLASINMLGYLAGSLICALLPMRARPALRAALPVVAVATFGMGLTDAVPLWLALRFVAGVASAALMVHGIAWSMGQLRAAGRADLEGVAFSGTGAGIVATGLLVAGLRPLGATAAELWAGFGVLSIPIVFFIWRSLNATAAPTAAGAVRDTAAPSGPAWALAAMYGLLGFAYMIPAVYLPLIAGDQLHLPALREWFWPLFGAAAALATLALPRLPERIGNRTALAACCMSMLAGMLLSVAWPSIAGLCIGTVLVGSATMPVVVLTMREARLLAPRDPTRLIAALTTAFGIGQAASPLAGAWLAERTHGFGVPMLMAAATTAVALGFALVRAPARRTRRCPRQGSPARPRPTIRPVRGTVRSRWSSARRRAGR